MGTAKAGDLQAGDVGPMTQSKRDAEVAEVLGPGQYEHALPSSAKPRSAASDFGSGRLSHGNYQTSHNGASKLTGPGGYETSRDLKPSTVHMNMGTAKAGDLQAGDVGPMTQ